MSEMERSASKSRQDAFGSLLEALGKRGQAANASKEGGYEFSKDEEDAFRELVGAMEIASTRYMWVVFACTAFLALLAITRNLTALSGLSLVTDILNHIAIAALMHTGSMHFQAIIETTGSDIECLLLGLAHIADLYKQLAAVWLATAILTFTSSAADWPNAPVLITVLALAAAAMRVMDIYAGPVSEQSAWFSTLTLPLTIVKANFQLLSDDDVDMTALAERVKVAREKQAALGEQLASAASQEDAAAEEFQDAEEVAEELSADDVGAMKEWLGLAALHQREYEFTRQQERFFKELMTSLRRAESAISLLGLASLLSITVKLAQADFVNVIPALLDVRAWWLTRALMNSLHSKFVAVTETEGSDISALLHAVGRGRPGMTLTKQFDGLKTAGQITTVGKVIAMLPVAAALLGLTAAGVLAPVLRPLQPLLGKIEGSAVYSRVLDVLLVVKRVANTFWGVNF